jgi:hypothetical protein
MLEECLFWEASAALALISTHVGRLRLVGVKDCFADEMDAQAREMHRRLPARGAVIRGFFIVCILCRC